MTYILTYEGREGFEATYEGVKVFRSGHAARVFVSVENKIAHYLFHNDPHSTCKVTKAP